MHTGIEKTLVNIKLRLSLLKLPKFLNDLKVMEFYYKMIFLKSIQNGTVLAIFISDMLVIKKYLIWRCYENKKNNFSYSH